jgi:hypothetical protein
MKETRANIAITTLFVVLCATAFVVAGLNCPPASPKPFDNSLFVRSEFRGVIAHAIVVKGGLEITLRDEPIQWVVDVPIELANLFTVLGEGAYVTKVAGSPSITIEIDGKSFEWVVSQGYPTSRRVFN